MHAVKSLHLILVLFQDRLVECADCIVANGKRQCLLFFVFLNLMRPSKHQLRTHSNSTELLLVVLLACES
jgi:hypothetical protein